MRWILWSAFLPSLLMSNSVNPPVGKTGAPGETTCASCHAGAAAKGAVVMEFSTLGYAPGMPIKIRVHVWSDNFVYTGMQITARLASNELQQAGHFTAGEFTTLRTQNGLEYVSQSVVTGTTVFTVIWTPPAANVGNIRFYATGVTGMTASQAEPNAYSASYTMTPGTREPAAGYRWQAQTLPGLTDPRVTAVSSDGKITGTQRLLPQNITGGFIRDANGLITTFTPPTLNDGVIPSAINSAGKVVGYYFDKTGPSIVQRGFIRDTDGAFTSFGVPGATSTTLGAITDGGLITGTADGTSFQLTNPPSFVLVDPAGSGLRTVAVTNAGTVVQTGSRSFGGVGVLKNGTDTAGFTSCEWSFRGGAINVAVNDSLDYVASCSANSGGFISTSLAAGSAGTRRLLFPTADFGSSVSIAANGQFGLMSNSIPYLLTPCSITPAVTAINAPAAGGSVSVAMNGPTDCAANVSSDLQWIRGSNTGTTGPLTLTFDSNQTGSARTGSVWVAGVLLQVTQPAAPCQVSLFSATTTFPSTGGSATLNVNSSFTACPWTASSNVSWINFTGTTGATGSASIPFTVAPNNGTTARTGVITVGDSQITITQSGAPACTYGITPSALQVPASANTQIFNITTGAGCTWSATSPVAWITASGATAGTGGGTVTFQVGANTSADPRAATLTIAGINIAVVQFGISTATTGLKIAPMPPCRLLETRSQYAPAYQTGVYGPPFLSAGTTRTIRVNGFVGCPIPANAKAMVFNVTLVPRNGAIADVVTVYPSGEAQPDFWTIRSPDGQIVANTAIVKVGVDNSVNVYTSNDADVLLDAFAYFTDDPALPATAYYPLTPCRVVETRAAYRQPAGPFGPPTLGQAETRRFKFPGNGYCNVPVGATAYSVTLTAVPPGPLAYLTAWSAGLPQPIVSNMNSFAGRTLANNLIVPVSPDGSMDVFAYNASDIIIDINGYFGPDNGAGLYYFPVTQCRASDTRATPFGGFPSPFGGPLMGAGETRALPLWSSTTRCGGLPPNAKAYVVNATAMPGGSPMPFLTMWDTGGAQPNASQLNAFEGQTVTNTAIVPAGANGSINVYTYRQTHLVLDISGYFGR
ncbi:MAG: hypothetical protein HY820_20355 [Acidobacteria bacterium]|nr:hypothetical protein [Acidobacteriota bacterium]